MILLPIISNAEEMVTVNGKCEISAADSEYFFLEKFRKQYQKHDFSEISPPLSLYGTPLL